jgi:hypothetical protein
MDVECERGMFLYRTAAVTKIFFGGWQKGCVEAENNEMDKMDEKIVHMRLYSSEKGSPALLSVDTEKREILKFSKMFNPKNFTIHPPPN